MENGNSYDIFDYIEAELPELDYSMHLGIARKAQSMFLWVVLVSRAVHDMIDFRGVDPADPDVIFSCIQSMPSDIQQLIRNCLDEASRISTEGPSNRNSIQFSFWIVHNWSEVFTTFTPKPNVALIAACEYVGDLSDYKTFVQHCSRIKTRIVSLSCGLLAVRPIDQLPSHAWALPEEVAHSREGQTQRTVVAVEGDTAALCTYLGYEVDWLHRCVCDFFLEGGVDAAFEVSSDESMQLNGLRVFEGELKLLGFAPSAVEGDWVGLHTAPMRAESLVHRARALFVLSGTASLFDRTRCRLPKLGYSELHSAWRKNRSDIPLVPLPVDLSHEVLAEWPFWIICLRLQLYDHVSLHQKHLIQLDGDPGDGWIQATLLCNRYETGRTPSFHRVPLKDNLSSAASSLALGLLAELTMKLRGGSPDAQKAQTFHAVLEGEPKKTWYTDCSWTTRRIGLYNADETIRTLCTAFLHFCRALSSVSPASLYNDGPATSLLQVLYAFVVLLDECDIYIGTKALNARSFRKRRLVLQSSAGGFPQRGRDMVLSLFSEHHATTHEFQAVEANETKIRVLAYDSKARARKMTRPFLTWQVPKTIADGSCNCFYYNEGNVPSSHEPDKYKDVLDLSFSQIFEDKVIRHKLIKYVQDNTDGQLGAWDQLLLLACIRSDEEWSADEEFEW